MIRTRASNEWDRRGRRLQPGSKKSISDSQLDEFLNRAENNIPFFAKYFCYREYSAAQRQVAKYLREEKNTIAVFSRQTGKTTVFGDYDAHELTFREYPDGSEDFTMIFAPIQEQAQLIFESVEKVFKNNTFLKSRIATMRAGGKILMKNDNKLLAKTASPNAHVRGHSPKKIQIDESQDISDIKYYEDILPSGSTTEAKIQEIGTPKKRNHFWRTFTQDRSYKKVLQEWYKCPFISKQYVMDRKKTMTKAKFDQEFNCIWNLDVGSAWPIDMITKTCILPETYYKPSVNNQYFAGIDIGKHPAETVLSVGKGSGRILSQVYLLRLSKLSIPKIANKLYDELLRFQPMTCIDATRGSQGEAVAELLNAKFTEEHKANMIYKLIPEHFNNQLKSEMVNDVEILGESHRLKLFNNTTQKRQMIAYEKKESAAGNDIYFSEELSDIVQGISLMVRAFVRYGLAIGSSFLFRSSGSSSVYSEGFSFANDIPKDRPSW